MNDVCLPGYKKPKEFLKLLTVEDENVRIKAGELKVLALFRSVSERVPAYRDFLKKNKIHPDKIKFINDFQQLPTVDKNNYLRAYPREALCWDGKFSDRQWVISTTSGSTGEPYYFPRTEMQDRQYAWMAEMYLLNNFDIQSGSTLYIDGFAMGAWIGGLFTYQAIRYVVSSGNYRLSIITPGINKKEILNAVKNLGRDFDQIIIGGYPPFIKDTVDDGINQGFDWTKYRLGFIFSAEGFSESYRDYILEKTGTKSPYLSTLNHYGTVDLGTMAHETPYTILLRRILLNQPEINLDLFKHADHQPTVAQYIPELFYFEAVNENLICSADSGFPLVRYDLKDKGGIHQKNRIGEFLKNRNIDINSQIKTLNLDNKIWNLPLVYVHERSDFIVKLYGANIYPNTVRKVLGEHNYADRLTGKFTMQIINDRVQNQYLEINVEMKQKTRRQQSLSDSLSQRIVEQLLKENSEFRSNYREAPQKQIPRVVLWPYEDKKYFALGGKHKWVK
jgi:phenylacetate-CoA ligase